MNLLPFLPKERHLLLESQSKSFVLCVCVYFGFLFWTPMHLGLEFRAGDARGASSVPCLYRECPHSWIWHKALVSTELLFSQQC